MVAGILKLEETWEPESWQSKIIGNSYDHNYYFHCRLCTSHINILLYLICYTAVLGTLTGLRPIDNSVFLDSDLTTSPSEKLVI